MVKSKKNLPNSIIKNLDTFPARHLIDLDNYHAAFAILTSRGCPFKCTFCSRPVTGEKWRGRSPKNVVDEIESMLTDYPKIAEKLERNITISDECFNLNKKRAKEICDEILRRKLDITFQCVNGFHPSAVDIELLEKVKKAGCKEIWFGIESGNEQILKRMKKGTTKDGIKRAVEFAKKAGIETIGGHFIIGLEDETIETARDSIRFMKELNLNFAGFNQATPLPNTDLWGYVENHGHFLFEYDDIVNYKSFKMGNTRPQFETPEFRAEERIKAYDEAIKELDKILRRRMLSPKNLLKHANDIRSFKDVIWAANRVRNIIFGKDLRRQFQPKPRK